MLIWLLLLWVKESVQCVIVLLLMCAGQGCQVPFDPGGEPYPPSGSLLQEEEDPPSQLEIVGFSLYLSFFVVLNTSSSVHDTRFALKGK